MKIENPILRGFHPDPSLVATDHGYYIATSTFEWFPGVRILYSPDLVHWTLVSHGLTDDRKVDLTGVDSACGIWAPNLTWDDGTFYLVYTIVYTNRPRCKDTYNFYVTAKDVRGPWSDPVVLNRSGFDPSIFHDTDGKKYLVNMTIDYDPANIRFSGIDIQELDVATGTLLGEPKRVYRGSFRGTTEGPNVMKHDGWYYLVCAEGGTEFGHCAVILRSRDIWGPYEDCPANPVITSSGKDCRLQRAGHMQAIQSRDGGWYIAHLCSRPLDDCSILGRETAIQNVEWTKDGWLKLSANDDASPEDFYEVPDEPDLGWENAAAIPTGSMEKALAGRPDEVRYTFEDGEIPLDFLTLRRSFATNGISVQNGKLQIVGGCSPMSKFGQGLAARTQESLDCDFTAVMEFAPRHRNHLAGMVVYYNYDNFYWLFVTREGEQTVIRVWSDVNRELAVEAPVALRRPDRPITLHAKIRREKLQFCFREEGDEQETMIGSVLDMHNISDEHVVGNGFTGSMLGVNCADLQGDGVSTSFSEIVYSERV